jgi:S-adenosylmethionine synthetase
MSQQRIYISESLTEGHPDKLCDQISDAVVDHLLMQDPCARVRAECAVARAIVFIAARFASSANIDFAWLARKVIQRIGYDHPDFNPRTCSIITSPLALTSRAADQFDADTLTDAQIEAIPARNQVTVFGFACNQTPERMPLPITLAHRIARQLSRARKEQMIPGLMPDARVQVGVAYKGLTPQSIYSITIEAHLDEKGAPDPPRC